MKVLHTSLRYFANRLALVLERVHTVPGIRKEDQMGFERSGDYYLIKLAGSDDTHVFHEDDIQMASKVPINNEVP